MNSANSVNPACLAIASVATVDQKSRVFVFNAFRRAIRGFA
jgi:hypothetical protein